MLGYEVGFGRWVWLVSGHRSSSRTDAATPNKCVSRRLSTKGRVLWAHTASEASGTGRWARLESGWVCATWSSSRGVRGVHRHRATSIQAKETHTPPPDPAFFCGEIRVRVGVERVVPVVAVVLVVEVHLLRGEISDEFS